MIALFPGEYIHVGGDEAVKDQWKASPRVQAAHARARRQGRACAAELFHPAHGRFLTAQGRRLIGWDEILEGGLAPDATVMSWRGIEGASRPPPRATMPCCRRADAVSRQSPAGHRAPPGRGRVVSLEDIYASIRCRPRLPKDSASTFWACRRIVDRAHAHRGTRRVHGLAARRRARGDRLVAGRMDWAGFRSAVAGPAGAYRALGFGYAQAPASPAPTRTPHQPGTEILQRKLLLSLEDDAPVHGERAVFLVDIMEPCWIFRARIWPASRDRGVGRPVPVQLPDRRGREEDPAAPAAERRRASSSAHRRLRGETIAVLPLAPAVRTTPSRDLPPGPSPGDGRHDLCLTFTQAGWTRCGRRFRGVGRHGGS